MTSHGPQPSLATSLGQWVDAAFDRILPRGSRVLLMLVLLTLLSGFGVMSKPESVPIVILLVPLIVSNLLLSPRHLPWFVVFVLLVLAVLVPVQPEISVRMAISVVVMFVIGFFVLLASFQRSQLGVAGAEGESMFVDLRDQIMRQGTIPPLPSGWYAASEVRSAGGTPYAGDFVVANRQGDRLQVVVVDVSGKGQAAGTRALMLSGAISGLIQAVAPEEFLAAANTFLLNQEWEEGFATAIHLTLDLASGDYVVRSAGHPPAALHDAGSGRWGLLASSGPVLGLIEDATYEPASGTMRPGDALLLYTDGMVETPDRDIALGIDKMLGRAQLLLRGGWDGGAGLLVQTLGSRHDDRALLLVHRRRH